MTIPHRPRSSSHKSPSGLLSQGAATPMAQRLRPIMFRLKQKLAPQLKKIAQNLRPGLQKIRQSAKPHLQKAAHAGKQAWQRVWQRAWQQGAHTVLPWLRKVGPQLLPVTPSHVSALLLRFWLEYRQLWRALILRDLVDRLFYLLAFGFGMGAMVHAINGLPYLTFLVPGIAASNGVFVMTLAMTFGVYERMNSNRLWQAWLSTPIRLPDVVLAELLYASLRCLPSIIILLVLAGLFMGAVPSFWGTVLSLPILMLANLAMGAIALCFTAHVKRTLQFALVNTFWTTPMFLFSGVFFDIDQAPVLIKIIAFFMPLHHVIDAVRPLMTGQDVSILAILFDIIVLAAIFLGGYHYALSRFHKRLFD